MHPFTFLRPSEPSVALKTATSPTTKFIAGGTNLLDLMKLDVEQPKQLIDINGIALNKIERLPSGSLRIGAGVKNTALAYHPEVMKRYPVLSEAILSGASAQLRNMATTAGNLMQRTRCYYFYDVSFPCNKRKPGSGCPAIDGYNRMHAVLGTSDQCIATHPSDMCVAMAALGAEIVVQSAKGMRKIPFAQFHRLPGNTPHLEHSLLAGELILGVEIADIPYATRSHYLKVRDRASYEFALASAAVALDMSHGVIRQARIALGGVGTKPCRSPEAEKALAGAAVGEDSFRKAAEAALSDAKTSKHNAFKPELARRTLVRALITASQIS